MKKSYLLIFGLVFLYSRIADAQSTFRLGVTGSYSSNYNSMKVDDMNDYARYNLNYDKWFNGARGGIAADFKSAPGSPFIFGLKITSSSQSQKAFLIAPDGAQDTTILTPDNGGDILIINDQFNISSKIHDIVVSPGIKYNFYDNFHLTGGVSAHFLQTSYFEIHKKLWRGTNFQLNGVKLIQTEESNNDTTLYSGEIPGSNKIIISANLGLMYEFRINSLSICPFIETEYYIGNISDKFNWKMYGVSGGLDVMIEL